MPKAVPALHPPTWNTGVLQALSAPSLTFVAPCVSLSSCFSLYFLRNVLFKTVILQYNELFVGECSSMNFNVTFVTAITVGMQSISTTTERPQPPRCGHTISLP